MLLILVAGGLFGGYALLTSFENEHLTVARSVSATVSAMDPQNSLVTLSVPGLGRREIGTVDPDHPVSTREPVLLDPTDHGWLRLVAEPADQTYLLTGALLVVLIALPLGYREVAGIRWLGSVAGRSLPARRVLVDSDGRTTYLYPVGAGPKDPQFAVLSTEPERSRPYPPPASARADDQADTEFGRLWRDEPASWIGQVEPGLVLGDLHTGSWVAVLIGDAVLFPRGPLGRARELPRWWAEPRETSTASNPGAGPRPRTSEAAALPGLPVTAPGPVPADLPWTLRPDRRARLIGWFQLSAGLLIALLLMPTADRLGYSGGQSAAAAMLLVAALMMRGWVRITQLVRLEADGAVLVGATRVYRVAWAQVHGVRLKDDTVLAVAWAPDLTFETEPLPRAPEAAAAILALRDQAISGDRPRPAPDQAFRWGAGALLVGTVITFGVSWVVALQS